MDLKDTARGFVAHGVSFHRTQGNQAIGDCIFCGKESHFFVNMDNRLWDCKRCSAKGNFNQFLELVSKQNQEEIKKQPDKLDALCANRKLPRSAFIKWEIGWNGKEYTLPIRSPKGFVQDLRRYRLGSKCNATTGATLGLMGSHKLALMPGADVYVCEGEWDTIALAWLFKKLDTNCVAVGVPGASIMKDEWIPLFENRNVFLLHDNDIAGENGKRLCMEKLKGVAREIQTISWPASLPQGFDVRDFVTNEAVREKKPRNAWLQLRKLLIAPGQEEKMVSGGFKGKRISREEVMKAYQKWLHLTDDEVLQVIFGTAFANKIQGEPLWMFLVAPPGGSKSELLMSLSQHPSIESVTSITPHTLISGANMTGGLDPSLLPKLNNRILVIKDFTTILSSHFTSRDEIFGTLRDCYDGKTEKSFGTGLKRSYTSHFGIIAGVTPKIEEFGNVHQSLGERFLKYRIDTGEKAFSEADRIRRALKNINKETQMRSELCTAANQVLSMPLPDILPKIPDAIFEKIVNLAQTTAMMRGVVERDRYTQRVLYKPAIEVGTRLAKQLAKLALGISIYLQKNEIGQETYRLICRIAMDTAPDRAQDIVRGIWEGCKRPEDAITTGEVSSRTRLPTPTCLAVLQDLELLQIVNRRGKAGKYEWSLGEKIIKLIEEGQVYRKKLEPSNQHNVLSNGLIVAKPIKNVQTVS